MSEDTRQIRCLIVSRWFPPSAKTRAVQIGRVALALHQAGCSIRVVTGSCQGDAPEWPFIVHYAPCSKDPAGYRLPLRPVLGSLGVLRAPNLLLDDWVTWATTTCERIGRESNWNIILTASHPNDSHVVGIQARKQFDHWISFFSDPYPAHWLPRPYFKRRRFWHERYESNCVRLVLGKSDAIVMPSRYGFDVFRKRFDLPKNSSVYAIPHIGKATGGLSSIGAGYLVHIGDLTNRDASHVIDAVARTRNILPDTFRGVLFVGPQNAAAERYVERTSASDCARFIGPVNAEEAGAIANSAAALLLLEAEMPQSPFLPSKFVDYYAAGRPVIAVTPPVSAVRDYLLKHGGGLAVEHDECQIASALHSIFSNKETPRAREHVDVRRVDKEAVFSPRVVGAAYLSLFRALLYERKR